MLRVESIIATEQDGDHHRAVDLLPSRHSLYGISDSLSMRWMFLKLSLRSCSHYNSHGTHHIMATVCGSRFRSALSQLRNTPVAGPSRLRLTPFRHAQTRLASTRPAPGPSPPITSRVKASQRAPAPAPSLPNNPPSPTASPNPPNAGRSKWPWRPIPSSPGVIEEERVIFSRPYEGPLGPRVKMLWFIVPVWGLAVGVWFTIPKLPEKEEEEEEGTV
jgi:hypothetical protein